MSKNLKFGKRLKNVYLPEEAIAGILSADGTLLNKFRKTKSSRHYFINNEVDWVNFENDFWLKFYKFHQNAFDLLFSHTKLKCLSWNFNKSKSNAP